MAALSSASHGKKKTPMQKFLIPSCVLTLTLIVFVYIPSNTKMTILTHPKEIQRPPVPVQEQQYQHDEGALFKRLIFDGHDSSIVSDSTYTTTTSTTKAVHQPVEIANSELLERRRQELDVVVTEPYGEFIPEQATQSLLTEVNIPVNNEMTNAPKKLTTLSKETNRKTTPKSNSIPNNVESSNPEPNLQLETNHESNPSSKTEPVNSQPNPNSVPSDPEPQPNINPNPIPSNVQSSNPEPNFQPSTNLESDPPSNTEPVDTSANSQPNPNSVPSDPKPQPNDYPNPIPSNVMSSNPTPNLQPETNPESNPPSNTEPVNSEPNFQPNPNSVPSDPKPQPNGNPNTIPSNVLSSNPTRNLQPETNPKSNPPSNTEPGNSELNSQPNPNPVPSDPKPQPNGKPNTIPSNVLSSNPTRNLQPETNPKSNPPSNTEPVNSEPNFQPNPNSVPSDPKPQPNGNPNTIPSNVQSSVPKPNLQPNTNPEPKVRKVNLPKPANTNTNSQPNLNSVPSDPKPQPNIIQNPIPSNIQSAPNIQPNANPESNPPSNTEPVDSQPNPNAVPSNLKPQPINGNPKPIPSNVQPGNPIPNSQTKPNSLPSNIQSYNPVPNQAKANDQTEEGNCKPTTKIIFIKTHKTGSTTTASIFERFGYRHKLLFVLPRGGHVLSNERPFTRRSAMPMPKSLIKTHPHFDILANHAVYNRKEMDFIIPNATYITILRDPVHQLESAFGYFEMARGMQIGNRLNPFQTFMQDPLFYYTHRNYSMKTRSKNGQLYDLGLTQNAYSIAGDSRRVIQAKIDTLDKELDMVLLTEYFDESLVLMRKRLCWTYDDILYISNGIRSKSHRFTISSVLADKIRRWNAGDVLLYNHFNATFWKKVQDYGPNFAADLEHFRQLEKAAMDKCVDSDKFDKHDRRENKFVINTKHSGTYCQDLLRADVPYTGLLRSQFKALDARMKNVTSQRIKRQLTNHGS